ncbi:epoxide hydrolase 1 [Cryphonectria parasitica EP155]|uniref:Epoxide hydrolase 1 n=1 Tax=Cryphonectria parasitica (strain ATCC 38755 / EP155) TaxID=660469 RepID=A0A9P5CTY2_CRYP1|nr:epoxide hydrolase 1 [Cryphonectria parasitica EP155]KAF3770823.1 epoxide hydrolase 1 [Cryphonectria parasitica EP155]
MSSFNGFDTVPAAASGKAEPFQLHVPDSEVADFKDLLRLSRIGPETWENSVSTREGGKYFGVTRDWLSSAKTTWLTDFDWRKHESRINSFPNFKIQIEDGEPQQPLSIHFAALFSKKKDAVPVLFMHGWPGCHLEFLPMLDLLRTKYTAETLPFHAVVPSLPGYGLSSGPPLDRDFACADAARVLNKLMVELGFGAGYIAQGGDLGSFLARQLSSTYDECKAYHVNLLRAGPEVDQSNTEGLDEEDLLHLKKAKTWWEMGLGYAIEHSTRPATIGLVLSSNPLALLAWIGEKYLEWSDTDIELEQILELTSYYWFTSSLPRCIWPYRDLFSARYQKSGWPKTDKPLGYSAFCDLAVLPKGWQKHFPNMKFRRDHDKGGHFAALEQPELFLEDVEEFVLNVVGPLP